MTEDVGGFARNTQEDRDWRLPFQFSVCKGLRVCWTCFLIPSVKFQHLQNYLYNKASGKGKNAERHHHPL